MADQPAYIIIDIGTGNVRVAITGTNGNIISVERTDVKYKKDELYPEALFFEPDRLWDDILQLTSRALQKAPGATIKAITASSQREGIVLLGSKGEALAGLPNHDHRGREWENAIEQKSRVYELTGRYPTSLFSALKLIGMKHKRPEIFKKMHTFVSISDWAQFKLSGIAGYEHSQASETVLYDVAKKSWSKELCNIFGLNEKILPPLHASGTVSGKILPEYAKRLKLSPETEIVVGGADTQLAIKSTQPAAGDVVIVSGTTTPVIKIVNQYTLDKRERTWTNRHVEGESFILEANAGVTGLNYQWLKEIFYPNEGYEVMEKELSGMPHEHCVASLGSLVADEKKPLTKGGFIFTTPVSHGLTRASFVWATLWDIACCIKENYDCLCDVTAHHYDYVWACGGGFQSRMLRQSIASLIQKKVRVRQGFHQASVVGGAFICNDALKVDNDTNTDIQIVQPEDKDHYRDLYDEWKKVRAGFKQIF